ncbi:MAG: murein L,D-transpeptidase catalytic domain family protein [Deltaproteobacteria bacterium]|nr:murein L,D-transpeptidase catalytic domain family protein [Deltaproteobacteria bacterium]
MRRNAAILGLAALCMLSLGASGSETGPDSTLLERARVARDCAVESGLLDHTGDRLAIIDFSLPSDEKRLWVIDNATGAVLFHELVAHGKNTGVKLAEDFSDIKGSNQSSLGLYVGAEPYIGKHGYSLRLDGLEPGINGNARDRAIVVHGAEYATNEFVQQHGRLGRSFGCPAVRPEVARPLIDELREGTPLFAWHAASDWSATSSLSSCSAR